MDLNRYFVLRVVCVVVFAMLNSHCTKAPDRETSLRETLVPGWGLGKIVVGAQAFPLITDVLGPADVVTERGGYGVHIYGEDPSKPQLEILVNPPVKEGIIWAVFVYETFRGTTNKGIRMGDPLSRVLELHGKPEHQGSMSLTYGGRGPWPTITVFEFTRSQQLKRIEVWFK